MQRSNVQRLNLFLPPQIIQPLRALSEKDGRGMTELVRLAIIEFLAKNKQQ